MAKHIVYAPNVVCICADELTETSCGGRLYTRYDSTSESFDDISALLLKIDRFFDKINYPEASTRSRSFNEDKTGSMQPRKINHLPEMPHNQNGKINRKLLATQIS